MREELRAERRDRIVTAATTVFSRFGYRKTALEDVASQAGVGKATLYHYFSGKDELFGAVIHRYYSSYVAQLKDAISTVGSPIDKLRRYAAALLEQHRRASASFVPDPGDKMEQVPFVIKHIMRYREMELDVLRGVLRAGVEAGEFRPLDVGVVANLLFAVFRGMIGSACEAPGNESVIIDEFMGILLNGLLAEKAD